MNASNITNSSAIYVFVPVNKNIKIAIACVYVITAVYALVANSLILYFTSKRPPARMPYSRQALVDRYIQSLALSDILCSLISTPMFTSEMFVDFVKTHFACKVVRYFPIYFPAATVCNYILIGIERYVGIFHPFVLPSDTVVKRFVIATWIVAAFVDFMSVTPYNLVRYDLGNNLYTVICRYDNSAKPIYRNMFLLVAVIVWIIPLILLMFSNIRIMKHLRGDRVRVNDNNEDGNSQPAVDPQVLKEKKRNYKFTSLFVTLIFAFILPYMLYFFYTTFNLIFKPKISFTADYIIRYLNVYLTYANGAIGSTILFYNSGFHRKHLVSLFRRIFCANEN